MSKRDYAGLRQSMRIRFDFNNAMASSIGDENGVSDADLTSLSARIANGHSEIARKRRAGDLDWMLLPASHQVAADIEAYVGSVAGRFDNFVVLGIGGSALGNIALSTALNPPYYNLLSPEQRGGRPRLFVLDNVDPDQLSGFLRVVDPRRTLFNVITKSGTTAETMAQFLIVREILVKALGEAHRDHIVTTTDAKSGELRKIIEVEKYQTFVIPGTVGGRFSVLSPVGLISAAITGIDIQELLAGAAFGDEIASEPDLLRNPAYANAAIHYLGYEAGRTLSVMMPYSQALKDVADWYCQLWAESLGKRVDLDGRVVNVGPTPIKALGVTDQHSQVQLYAEGRFDKIVNFIAVDHFHNEVVIPSGYPPSPGVNYLGGHTLNELMDVERQGTAVALSDTGRPSVTFHLPAVNAFTVGQLMFILEVQTAMAGELLHINAFDQPGVEAGKVAAYALMGRAGFETRATEISASRKSSPAYII